MINILIIIISTIFFTCTNYSQTNNQKEIIKINYTYPKKELRNDIFPILIGIDSLLCDFISKANDAIRFNLKSINLLSENSKQLLNKCIINNKLIVQSDSLFFTAIDTTINFNKFTLKSVSFNAYQSVYNEKYKNDGEYFLILTISPSIISIGTGFIKYSINIINGTYYLGKEIESFKEE